MPLSYTRNCAADRVDLSRRAAKNILQHGRMIRRRFSRDLFHSSGRITE